MSVSGVALRMPGYDDGAVSVTTLLFPIYRLYHCGY